MITRTVGEDAGYGYPGLNAGGRHREVCSMYLPTTANAVDDTLYIAGKSLEQTVTIDFSLFHRIVLHVI